MSLLDWLIAVAPIFIVISVGLYCKTLIKGVSDFTAARRSASRYLLCIAGGELQAGAVVFISWYEAISNSGFALSWWNWFFAPVGIIIGMTGFLSYRFRETRAMTLAQFFELRYNKSFRVFTGIIGFGAGLLNFSIIPIMGATCVSYFLGFPATTHLIFFDVPTPVILMAIFLSVAVFTAFTGGLITVMVINCLEGMMAQIFYIIIIAALLCTFHWSQISQVLSDHPKGQSFLDPFDGSGLKDFNFWYVVITVLTNLYWSGTWQNASGYGAAAITPHEGRMGGLLGGWRELGKGATFVLMSICTMTFLAHPDFFAEAQPVKDALSQLPDAHTQVQMSAPVSMAHYLPIGIKGVLCAVFLMGIFGGDATHLNSWGGIFVQDVLVPLRKKPFGPKTHLLVLRCAIVGVAVFAFLFGVFVHVAEYINMWWAITVAIFCGGAGAAYIGGMYWKKGTSAGAFAGMILGSGLSLYTIYLAQYHKEGFDVLGWHVDPTNGKIMSFFTTFTAMAAYIGVSLATCKEDFNLDRMLHRGKYAAIKAEVGDNVVQVKRHVGWSRLIGFDEDYSVGDKWIAGGFLGYSFFWSLFAVVGTLLYLSGFRYPSGFWAGFWGIVGIGLPVFFAVVTGIWFTWGGIRDIRRLFVRLKEQKVSSLDDGTVIDNRNLDEFALEEKDKGTGAH